MLFRFLSFVFLLMATLTIFSQDLPPIEKGVSQKLAIWRAQNYSDVRYKLSLKIKKNAPTLKGTIEIRLNVGTTGRNPRVSKGVNEKISSSDSALTNVRASVLPIILDWRKIKGHEHLSKISNVSINGKKLVVNPKLAGAPRIQPAMYSHYLEHLIFENGVKQGENVIKLNFESPILKSGSAITRYIDKEDGSEYIYSLFVPSDASTAFPVFDQPDLKARFKLTINSPSAWRVVSNQPIVLTRELDCPVRHYCPKTSYFSETKPISTYVFAFAAGPFATFRGTGRNMTAKVSADNNLLNTTKTSAISRNGQAQDRPLQNLADGMHKIFVRKSQADKFKKHAKEVFRLTRESIKYFEEYFDYEFPWPKYDLVLIPEFPFGGMEHAGATFLRESSIIFPTEPTANNYISRASLIFHENAHQWFGDTVTMKWFDDLWLKEGFATFMGYKAMEKVLPQYKAWKVFYERTKPRAYATDVTKGTTPIYQKIPNLNSAKSAYGNIVYQKAPGFLKQAEFFLGEKVFQTAVRAFLLDHEFSNAKWSDLVKAFEKASGKDLKTWADAWVKKRGLPIVRLKKSELHVYSKLGRPHDSAEIYSLTQDDALGEKGVWQMKVKVFMKYRFNQTQIKEVSLGQARRNPKGGFARHWVYFAKNPKFKPNTPLLVFPNYKDYGYGIFLLDFHSRKYILENIQDEKDDFLRSMMWGALWDSVRFAELAPKDYINLAIKNIDVENDDSTISSILGRVYTAYTYYLNDSQQKEFAPRLESLLIGKITCSKTVGQRITFYRAFLRIASSKRSQVILKQLLASTATEVKDPSAKARKTKRSVFKIYKGGCLSGGQERTSLVGSIPIRTKDKFDIVSRLIVLGDKDSQRLLANLEKSEKGDAAKRYAYAAKAGFPTKENKAKYWKDFVKNTEISENWIVAAFRVWNSPSHSRLTLAYLEKALAELPNLKQNRKIFFVNGWLASFIGGQQGTDALAIVNKFLENNSKMDIDLKRKILEHLDGLERAVKIRRKYSK